MEPEGHATTASPNESDRRSGDGDTVRGAQADPIVPDYSGACVANIVPALLQHREVGLGWIPDDVLGAEQVVVLVIDGLGHSQLFARAHLAPCLSQMTGKAITTVAPTTTATALTSIATGASPGEHGVVGYKMWVAGEVLNALRWSSALGDARERIEPEELQPIEPFVGRSPAVISQAQFAETGFTRAHLRGTDYRPYWLASSIPVEIRAALDEGCPFVYAYYDGIDKVAHISGLGVHYEAELAFVDRLVAAIIDSLPANAALVVTAYHGQVQVGDRILPISAEALALSSHISGEARFVWLHASGGRAEDLLECSRDAHSDVAWVVGVEQVLDERWFGATVTPPARARFGDVAIVAREPVALVDPESPGPALEGRHGSLTEAEMIVPLLTATG
ncbi:MAG: alkaline phosphatase family protein [Acidimicrobiales bacterium]